MRAHPGLEAAAGGGEMAAPCAERERQERLREAAALGDAAEVQRLVELGVSPNAQNEVNGWTCLHWACKRNHAPVVAYLLHAGADKEILTKKGERPAQLTSKREIRKMLGVEEDELPDLKKESDLPIIPNYLANPPFPYVYNTMSNSIPDPSMNGSVSHLEPRDTDSASLPDVETYTHAPLHHGNAAPEVADAAGTPSLPRGSTVPPHTKPVRQRGPVYQGSVSWSRSAPSPAGSNQSVPQQENGSCMGPVPAFQPVFFTGAFPLNMQELVLKVRIQNPNLRENDFIEIELDRQELTYKELLRVSCRELGVNPEHVQKIRKLPNTMLRKQGSAAAGIRAQACAVGGCLPLLFPWRPLPSRSTAMLVGCSRGSCMQDLLG
ncbi:ankyrin repeat domain-containing protein 40 isoform X2 [Pezoporus wallicus]|uniref:ankyrin repeat domain-containing protein 40 isoform X2 n=1 Tax=Pezoporus wallicus TaxID=35540 RepID=UPI0025500611|nr:ankyrin repeat domain-containing protein 40 isoform X2 [Pezoporus wallicus]XP_061311427.1 ankyrin repeat domain-containing protein 40 isoform X2 [Pezoporus flaviventris]